jgi:hypothetical protein
MSIGDQSNPSSQQSPGVSAIDSSASANLATSTPGPQSEPGNEAEFPLANIWKEFGGSETYYPAAHAPESSQNRSPGELQAWHWAELITGINNSEEDNQDAANRRITAWLEESAHVVSVDISALPNVFQTTRFCSEVRSIESPLAFLRAVAEKVLSGAISFLEAINHIGRNFGWDEGRLLKWQQGMENLAAFQRWLPAFIQTYDYLAAAFPLGVKKVDQLRDSLLQSIEEPHRFLEQSGRDKFEVGFLEFKKNYVDSYFVLHEDALHAMSSLKKDEVKVDAIALRNLDLLSGLQHMDQSYLNRVKLLAKWLQHKQCNLPLHQILEHYPRCYCNFHPGSHRHPADYAVQVNTIIEEGLEFFRTVLRGCHQWIMPALKAQTLDGESLKQITALLSDGPIYPLKAQAVNALNRILAGNLSEFLSEARKASDRPRA